MSLALSGMFLLMVVASSPLVTQEPPPGAGSAEALAQEAVRLVEAGDYNRAVTRFRAALERDPQQQAIRFQLARVLASLGRFEESRAEFAAVVAAHPQHSPARRGEITALLLLEQYGDARRKLEEGLGAVPRDGQLAHLLARLLATAPDDEVRDGQLALRLALSVYEVKKLYETGETVAMAYAEIGDFEKAIEMQRSLMAQAGTAGDSARIESLRERLSAYERNEPWKASSPAEIATATQPPQPRQ